jgi:hypothetical protein
MAIVTRKGQDKPGNWRDCLDSTNRARPALASKSPQNLEAIQLFTFCFFVRAWARRHQFPICGWPVLSNGNQQHKFP